MLTHAPLPQWFNLFRALLRRPPSDTDLAAPWCREGELAGWLSRSTWSLALIAQWRQSHASASPVRVWIPDYFCNASLAALRQTGAKLLFYPLTEKMAPDIAACRMLIDADPPDLFVLVHYFGQPTSAAATRDFCSRHGAWLIEDAAHVLRPVGSIGIYGDFVLYSPHKHLPIPDGAVLVVRTNGPGDFGADMLVSFGLPSTWPSQLRELQQQVGCSLNSGRARALVWFIKRVLQKLGVSSWCRSTTPFAEPLNPGSTIFPQLPSPFPSGLTRCLLAGFLSNLGGVVYQRQCHQLLWDTLLLNDEISCLYGVSAVERSNDPEWTPYLSTYRIDPDKAEYVYAHWQRCGLPVTTWPDLPPEVKMHRATHANAWYLRHSRLYLSVHQSLSADSMKRSIVKLGEPSR
jgi:hypothetical protein